MPSRLVVIDGTTREFQEDLESISIELGLPAPSKDPDVPGRYSYKVSRETEKKLVELAQEDRPDDFRFFLSEHYSCYGPGYAQGQ